MSTADEVRALTERAGLVRRGRRRLVHVVGRDRVVYLHRMLTQDIGAIAEGTAAYSCVLNAQGRILGDPVVWNVSEALILDLHQSAAATCIPHLQRTVITEDVVFEDLSRDLKRFSLVGPRTPEALEKLGVPMPEPGHHTRVDGDGWHARLLNRPLGSRRACEWILDSARDVEGFVSAFQEVSVPLVSHAAWDVVRVEERVPEWAAELTTAVMPLEARLGDDAISWTKGCFPGHEPVAKARNIGHPPRLLVRLDLSGPAVAGRLLLHEDSRVGHLTTAIVDPRDCKSRGLGYVRHAHVRRGGLLELEGGGEARVQDDVRR